MITRFKKNNRIGMLLLCLSLLALSSYGIYRIAILLGTNPGNSDLHNKNPIAGQPYVNTANSNLDPGGSQGDQVIGAHTLLKYKTVYKKCGHIEENVYKVSVDMIGLGYEDVNNRFAGWVIEKFNPEEIVLVSEAEGLDKQCLENSYIGVKDGLVTVFHGKPREGIVVKRQTSIDVSNLPSSEVTDLNQGIVITSDQEMFEILEGLSSLENY